MNYLAHIYLSKDHEMISIGNFMADHIKGNKYKLYSADLQKGILLHRQIDSYTDAHEIVRKSKRRLDDSYGLYRGVIIDIFYDHFLAKNWKDYSDLPLATYTQNFYDNLTRHYEILPQKIQYMSQYLIKDDWLLSYAKLEGIEKVLEGMNRRTMDRVHMDLAINDLKDHYIDFEKDFLNFFNELMLFTDNKLSEINKKYE